MTRIMLDLWQRLRILAGILACISMLAVTISVLNQREAARGIAAPAPKPGFATRIESADLDHTMKTIGIVLMVLYAAPWPFMLWWNRRIRQREKSK